MNWEEIDEEHFRAAVPGGWLVKTYTEVCHDQSHHGHGMQGGWDWRVAMAFVPDPGYEWVINQKETE